jgi:hypothetical protein
MKLKIIALCALFAGSVAMAQAQAPGSFSITCNPTLVVYQFSATQSVETFTCTTTAAVNGVPFNGLTFSQTVLGTASESNVWDVVVGVLANGDQVYIQFHTVARATSGVSRSGTSTYKIVGGTGIANGISGSGTCNGSGLQGKGSEMTCVGAYTTR